MTVSSKKLSTLIPTGQLDDSSSEGGGLQVEHGGVEARPGHKAVFF